MILQPEPDTMITGGTLIMGKIIADLMPAYKKYIWEYLMPAE